jgi:hypothetical protein
MKDPDEGNLRISKTGWTLSAWPRTGQTRQNSKESARAEGKPEGLKKKKKLPMTEAGNSDLGRKKL